VGAFGIYAARCCGYNITPQIRGVNGVKKRNKLPQRRGGYNTETERKKEKIPSNEGGVNDVEADGMWVLCRPLSLTPWERRRGRKEGAHMHRPTQPSASRTPVDNDGVRRYPLPLVFPGRRRKLWETTTMNKSSSLSPCPSSPSPRVSTCSSLPTPLVAFCSYFQL